ncbi:MAG: hypothetical protein IJY12_00395 [Clostridia bacterium]|nr:hypothetical protein [Clostridia bacterium]
MSALIEKTCDVKYTPDILKILGGDMLLYARGYNLLEYLSCDIDVLERRSNLFHDTVSLPNLAEVLNDTVDRLDRISQMVQMQNRVSEGDRDLYSIKELELYFEVIDRLSAYYAQYKDKFISKDYAAWLTEAEQIAQSEEYSRLKQGTALLIEKISKVKSISVGFNMDASLTPYESGILSINDKYIKSGQLVDRILRMDPSEDAHLLSMAPLVAPKKICNEREYEALNFSLYSALNKVFKKEIRQWEPEIDKYLKNHLDFILGALPDLKFIAGVSKIITDMRGMHLHLTKPQYFPKEEKRFCASNLYNPALAIKLVETGVKSGVVKNSVTFDEDGRIFLLTGANSGGKTVYMRAIGLIQIMAQLGMPVPADKLEISPADGIFVQLPLYSNRDSRLVEECEKTRAIFAEADEFSICIFDELFSSTDPSESIALSAEVLKAMCHMGARGIYSTHFHSLTDMVAQIHGELDPCRSKIDFLVAEVDEDSERRTYLITRRPPDKKSYAKTITDKYGISYERLTHI